MATTILIWLNIFAALVSAYSTPLACTGTCGNAHDPAIIKRNDGTYFRFSTNGKIAIHTAPNITGPWVYKGAAIPRGSSINLKGREDLWAPDVTKIGSLYYMLYAVSAFGSQDSAIGYATSSTMDVGSWTDRGETGIRSSKNAKYNAIDGNLVLAPDAAYITFGSFWTDLYIAPVSITEGRIRKTGSDVQIAFQPSGEHAVEAPYIFKNGGKWWLFFSAGKCCALDKNRPARGQEYKILACVSNGGPTGPYVDRDGKNCKSGGGTAVLPSHDWVYAPGGQGVYDDPSMGPIIYYHYVDTRIGYADGQKKFGWNRVRFDGGWPTV
ncbi:endo-1,5-alpha-L-arabinosidase [Microthyrium microscopicum]|uniref:Arabinan endo-1,5-alpha-L-arabinosidase n=1 Tax=Microthyrium microscopicum TaxID=703497 RepID=A0A6A6UEH6_9PEZI|nr:endo-1,5-alpha-L-arabinosidase [Microthyrium microscopicum]